MKKIEELTPAQTARFGEFIEKWTKIGLSTEKANRPEAEAAIIEMYKIAGLKAPKIVWCTSPTSQGITRSIVLKLEADGQLKKLAKPGASVRDSVRASVRASVGASVWASVGDSVRDSVRDSVGASVWDSGYGQHDANWLAFYDFFSEVCGLKEETGKLSGLWKQAQNAGWFLPHENICWVSERHNTLHCNTLGQLHNTEGMALTYPDGWGVYALNGVRFPEDLFKKVTSGLMPFQDILAIEDIDQRTQAMRFGDVNQFLKHVKAKQLDTYTKKTPEGKNINYALHLIPKGEVFTRDAYYAVYDDPSTGKLYMSGVEPCRTISEAMAWKMSSDIWAVAPKQWEALVPLVSES